MKRNTLVALLLAFVLLLGTVSLTACGKEEKEDKSEPKETVATIREYKSVEDMKADMIGTWTTADGAAQFVIEDNMLYYTYRFADGSSTDLEFSHTILEWNYENRQIIGNQTHVITVSEDGQSFTWSDKTFTKGGSLIPKP